MGKVASILGGVLVAAAAHAADVTVLGLFPNKALVQIDGGAMRTLSIGQKTDEGVVLVSVARDSATFDIDGKRTTLSIGQGRVGSGAAAAESTVVIADSQGLFHVDGQINGRSVQFTVDTGATYIALPESEARRISLDYSKGRKVLMRTANGNAAGYKLKLDTVTLGTVTVYDIDAVVIEGTGLTSPLLGMSFLNRMNMKREGDVMTLTRRY
jgi:aspartyl protease family protein